MKRYNSGSHTKHRHMYHIVWIPKYRKRILQGAIKTRLEELFEQCVDVNEWKIEELNIQEDHVHLMIRLKPTDRVCDVIGKLKGVSSRTIRKEFPKLEEFLWGDSFWADGYFSETVGVVSEEKVRNYIKNQ